MSRWAARRHSGFGKFGVAHHLERRFLGELYASKAEAAYAALLEVRRKAGEIESWRRAGRFPLIVNGLLVGHYRPDFEVVGRDGEVRQVEVKGAWNEADRLRVKLATASVPELNLLCVRRTGASFVEIPTPTPQLMPGIYRWGRFRHVAEHILEQEVAHATSGGTRTAGATSRARSTPTSGASATNGRASSTATASPTRSRSRARRPGPTSSRAC